MRLGLADGLELVENRGEALADGRLGDEVSDRAPAQRDWILI
jgi:hypothetical protein